GNLPAHVAFGSYELTSPGPLSTVDGGWKLTTFQCDPGSATLGAAGTLQLTLAPDAPDATCTATYEFVAPTRLQAVVRVGGSPAARTVPVLLEVSCADGSTGLVVSGATESGERTLPQPLSFLGPTTCTVRQTSAGIGPRDSVSATVVLDPPPGNPPGSG